MIISESTILKWNARNKKFYESKGYVYTKMTDEFVVKVTDLTLGSNVEVNIECDGCNKVLNSGYQDYLKCVKSDGKYYCNNCKMSLGFISFEKWCNENNKQNILQLWDYALNNCNPSEITYGTNKKYYFKCLNGLHKSELKSIKNYSSQQDGLIYCKACNSIGQYLLNTYGEDAIDKYWSDKNIDIEPFDVEIFSMKKIWIKCQKKDYHEDYKITTGNFTKGERCPCCATIHGKVHVLDSLGELLKNKSLLDLWSDKNTKSPYTYTQNSGQQVWWKCHNNKHDEYKRNVNKSNRSDFNCPECQNSKGEVRISEYLKLININYVPQKEFYGLVGLGNGNLKFDFYLPDDNILIEYQGNYHDGTVGKKAQSETQLKTQQTHDQLKRNFAINQNINLLEIWYWDFDNIEDILKNKLNKMED